MRWIENLRLKHKLQLAFMIVSLLSVGLFTAQATYNAKQAALAEIDSQLVMASQAYAYILGVDYHDQLPPRNQVDLKQKRQESVRLTEASQAMKVEFLYSHVEHEGKIFTANLRSPKNNWPTLTSIFIYNLMMSPRLNRARGK